MISLGYRLRNLPNRFRSFKQELLTISKIGIAAELRAIHNKGDGSRIDLGVLGRKLVTDDGAEFIVDAFQNLVELENMKYHASGTDNTAENVLDAALGVEVATRVAGTQTEGSAVQYVTVATIPYTGTLAIVEHGIFSAGAAGVLLDRTVFAAINVVNGDSIQFTYTLTVNSGG